MVFFMVDKLDLDSFQVTKKSGSNLAFCFAFMPAARKQGMTIYYAFCRIIDDIADDPSLSVEDKFEKLEECRQEISRCYDGNARTAMGKDISILLSNFPTIPKDYFEELIKGVEMDLTVNRYQSFDDLYKYCYRVASVVGLTSIEIFGYQNQSAKVYAVNLGLAFQLTNILRDIKKDAINDRIYIPLDEMQRFGYSQDDLMNFRATPAFLDLARFQYDRAEQYYSESAKNLAREDRRSMVAAESMRSVYHTILVRLKKENFPIFTKDISLGKLHKLWLITKVFMTFR